jgi:hypothetical protein
MNIDPREILERVLNATTEDEQWELLVQEMNVARAFGLPLLLDGLEVRWEPTGDAKKDRENFFSLSSAQDFFNAYGQRLEALRATAAELRQNDHPIDVSSPSRETFDELLSGIRLSAFDGQVVTRFPIIASLAAIALWTWQQGIVDWQITRCKECQKFIIDRSRGRKRETCSNKCRSAAYHKKAGYKEKQKKKREAKWRKAELSATKRRA